MEQSLALNRRVYVAVEFPNRMYRLLDPLVARSCRSVGSASTSAVGTKRTSRADLKMSVDRGRSEVTGRRSKRRE